MTFLVTVLLLISFLTAIVTGIMHIWLYPGITVCLRILFTSLVLFIASFGYLFAESRISKALMRHAKGSVRRA
jgi:hypothetical protein